MVVKVDLEFLQKKVFFVKKSLLEDLFFRKVAYFIDLGGWVFDVVKFVTTFNMAKQRRVIEIDSMIPIGK